eukprot:6181886-Pleurochrysis_carterae.AAC.1
MLPKAKGSCLLTDCCKDRNCVPTGGRRAGRNTPEAVRCLTALAFIAQSSEHRQTCWRAATANLYYK